MSQVDPPRWLNLAELNKFIDELRSKHRYPIGTEQYAAVSKVLLVLTAHGMPLEKDTQDVVKYLAPILCTTPSEQKDFPNHFKNHFKSWLNPTTETKPTDNVESPNQLQRWLQFMNEPLIVIKWHYWVRWRSIAVAVFAIFLLISSQNPIPSIGEGANPTIVLPPPTQLPTQLQNPGKEAETILWSMLGLVFLLIYAAFQQRLKFQQAEIFLEEETGRDSEDNKQFTNRSAGRLIIDQQSLLPVARSFRHRVDTQRVDTFSRTLDIERTLKKSLEQAGWFTPIYKR